MDAACHETAELWPKRISPGNLPGLQPYEQRSAEGMILSATTASGLGMLLLRLIEWIIEPPVIDLTLEEFGRVSAFLPPANTTVTSPGDQISSDILVLIAETTTYSMYVLRISYYLTYDMLNPILIQW